VDRIFDGEPHLYWDELIRCQSDHDDYVYSRGVVVMLGSNGSDSITQVLIVRHAWGVCGYVFSCLALNDIVIRGPQLSSHSLGT
jgi:hypothetical protein